MKKLLGGLAALQAERAALAQDRAALHSDRAALAHDRANLESQKEAFSKGRLHTAVAFAQIVSSIAVVAALWLSFLQVQKVAEQIESSRLQSMSEQLLENDRALVGSDKTSDAILSIIGPNLEDTKGFGDPDVRAIALMHLDFYEYAYVQARDLLPEAKQHGGKLVVSYKPEDAWQAWSSTIVKGFTEVPSLCDALSQFRSTYNSDFYDAVRETACPNLPE